MGLATGQQVGRPLSVPQLREAIAEIERAYDVRLYCDDDQLARGTALPSISRPAGSLREALTSLVSSSTFKVADLGNREYLLTHDPSAERDIRPQIRLEREEELASAESANRAAVAGTDAGFKSTDVLLIRNEPLYRAFDRIAEVYEVEVAYHPDEVPYFAGTLRQGQSVLGALNAATRATGLAYATLEPGVYVVAPAARLTREYAAEVVAGWREGRYRSPDDEVGELLHFRVGPPGLTAPTTETATVTGVLLDAETGEALIGANVLYPAAAGGTTTGLAGGFALALPTGRVLLELQSVGYVPQPIEVDVFGDGTLPAIRLREGATALAEVVVRARNEAEVLRQRTGGLREISSLELRRLPAFSGEPDVLQALARTPGVAATTEGSAAVSVRGGSLDANLVRQGGIPVLYPAHAFGLFPLFYPGIVESVDLYRGYVPAGFGGRVASVIDAKWRAGDFERYRLEASTGLLASRLGVEGPIVKEHVSAIVGVRGSHVNWLLAALDDGDLRRSVVDFADGSAAVSARWAGGRADLRGFHAEDGFRYGQRFGFAYRNRGARLEARQQVGEQTVVEIAGTVSDFRGQQLGVAPFPGRFTFTSGVETRQIEVSVSRRFSERLRASAGAQVEDYTPVGRVLVPGAGSPVAPFAFDDPRLETVAAYAGADYDPDERWSFSGGLRVLTAASIRPAGSRVTYESVPSPTTIASVREGVGETRATLPAQLQPRLRVTYAPTDAGYSLGLAYSRLAQALFQLSPTVSPTPADIFFVASEFLPITTSQSLALTVASNGKPRRFQRVGYELGVYYRRLRDGHDALGGSFLRSSSTPEQDFYTGDGYAAGAEVALRYEGLRTTLEVGYAYGRSFLEADRRYEALRAQPGRYFPASTDLPHQVNLTYSYRPTGRASLTAGWTFASGRPFTGIETLLPQDGRFVPAFTTVNGQRLPPTHRLDVGFGLDNREARRRGVRAGFGLSLYNVYGRDNPFSAFYDAPLGRLEAFQFSLIGDIIPAFTVNLQWD